MEKKNVREYLQTIGMSTFIKYFELFKQNYADVSNEIFTESFKKEEWSASAKNTKASTGKRIFKEGLEFDALLTVMSSSRVDQESHDKAEEIYKQYELAEPTIEYTKTIDVNKKQELLLEIYNFAIKEGLNIEDIVSSMIDRVNDALGSDKKASFNENADGYKFEVQLMDNVADIIDVIEEEDVKTINLADYKTDKIKKTTIRKGIKEFQKIFKSRLQTQNRKYANGMCYMPTIFNKLGINFSQNIEMQLSKITAFIKGNDQAQKVNEMTSLHIEKGAVFGKMNGVKVELFFNYDNQLHSFAEYINVFKNISLGHKKSVYRILDEMKQSLPTLKQFSDIVIKEIDNNNVNIKTKIGADKIVQEIKNANLDLEALKKELALIEKEMALELIPLRINIAMGKN